MRVTKELLKEENAKLRSERDTYFLTLNDLVEGKVTWFNSPSGAWRVGVAGINRANGGHVIVYANAMAQAYDYEFWRQNMRDYSPSHTDSTMIEYKNLFYIIDSWVASRRQTI